jgi:hypothetical protein
VSLLKGDLDCIVMKALEKDRTRRYESANGFAQDIQRYLAHERVSAVPPSTGYRFRRFARRNQAALGLAATLAFLVIGLLASLLLLFKELQAGKTGTIRINSNPEGAEVWHDGLRVGHTPFELNGISFHEYTYSLVLTNYESVTNTTILVAKKQMNDFTFLRPPPAPTDPGVDYRRIPTTMTAFASQGLTILGAQGDSDVLRIGAGNRNWGNWIPAQTNMVLSGGDHMLIEQGSWVTLRWSDSSVVRVNGWTLLQVLSPATNNLAKPSQRLNGGIIQISNGNGTTNTIRIITRGATAGIEG